MDSEDWNDNIPWISDGYHLAKNHVSTWKSVQSDSRTHRSTEGRSRSSRSARRQPGERRRPRDAPRPSHLLIIRIPITSSASGPLVPSHFSHVPLIIHRRVSKISFRARSVHNNNTFLLFRHSTTLFRELLLIFCTGSLKFSRVQVGNWVGTHKRAGGQVE